MRALPFLLALLTTGALAQNNQTPPPSSGPNDSARAQAIQRRQEQQKQLIDSVRRAEQEGISVRIKDITRFRGVRGNQLVGIGIVVGLAGQGDSARSVTTRSMFSNWLRDFGQVLQPEDLTLKNVAVVTVTAELPPFASNGMSLDVNIQSMGDAKSLAGGTLLQTPLYAAGDRNTVYVMAQGSVTLGGFDVSGGGSRAGRNIATAGRIVGGGIVERGAPTKVSFGGRMYLDLDTADMTTARRIEQRLREQMPEFAARATSGGTIELTLPAGMSEVEAMARIEALEVMADTEATIVINERTGTVVVGGNVRIGPAVIVAGGLNIRIDSELVISQPPSFSGGATVVGEQSNLQVTEDPPKSALLPPTTTVADLMRVLQALDLTASDLIKVLDALRQQGALKARIVSQ